MSKLNYHKGYSPEFKKALIVLAVLGLWIAGAFIEARADAYTSRYDGMFAAVEKHFSIPTGMLRCIGIAESSLRADAIGPSGEKGLMQLHPKYHPGVYALNPYESIYYAGGYLSKLHAAVGTWRLALIAYNWGITNVQRGLRRPYQVNKYANKVMRCAYEHQKETD